MTMHVFIVDSTTFRIHLENLFAGTGAKDMFVDFNNSTNSRLSPTREQMLVDMIADVSRVREGDQVIFYLQQNFKDGIREGKFYGVFKIKKVDNFLAFYDPNDKAQYLKNKLNKSLTFRVIIEPYQVYPLGVTEWEALDDIKNIISPHQMLWSLIYRKLKGNRGCTPITIYESQRLCNLIRAKNNRKALEINEKQLTFDKEFEAVKLLDTLCPEYMGRKINLNILPRLIKKYEQNKQFEHHLEALISKNLGLDIPSSLDKDLLENKELVWLGNQVSCGVGMQRIDILFSLKEGEQYFHCPVELKSTFASEDNIRQLSRYMDWMNQYFVPNLPGDVCPILITREIPHKQIGRKKEFKFGPTNVMSDYFSGLIEQFNIFNNEYKCRIKFIEYFIDKKDNIIFQSYEY